MVTFAEKITRLCHSAGFPVTRLGENTGIEVSRSTANSWVTRGAMPRPVPLKQIADSFKVPVEWLTDDTLGFDFDPSVVQQPDPMLETLMQIWKELDTMQRAELLLKAREIRG